MTKEPLKFAILSDIHAFADSFQYAIDAACTEGFDELIILGDLLGYGVQVEETLRLAQIAYEKHQATLIIGNHDQVYFDLEAGDTHYLAGKPEWIVESISWTHEKLQDLEILSSLPWEKRIIRNNVLLSHANPFEYGDWTYIRDEASAEEAAIALAKQGLRAGIFGHVHRHQKFVFDNLPEVHTIGSVGQPRDQVNKAPLWAMAIINDDKIQIDARTIPVCDKTYFDHLRATSLSPQTQEKIGSFFL